MNCDPTNQHHTGASTDSPEESAVQREVFRSGEPFLDKEKQTLDPDIAVISTDDEEAEDAHRSTYQIHNFRPFILGGVALLILAWWISATVLKATRYRW
jgi:concentrative nucleoside transporter, CNT family